MHKLSMQFAVTGMKVVYNKAGTLLSSATLDDPRVIVDTGAYWVAARSLEEARYLTAILNSATVLARIIPMQPEAGVIHAISTIWSGSFLFPNLTADRLCTGSWVTLPQRLSGSPPWSRYARARISCVSDARSATH